MAPVQEEVGQEPLQVDTAVRTTGSPHQALRRSSGTSADLASIELPAGISRIAICVNYDLGQAVTKADDREPDKARRCGSESSVKSSTGSKTTKRSQHLNDSCAAWLVQNKYFENVTLAVIALNAVWIGVDLENNHASMWTEADFTFQIADNFFCVYFTFEVGVRFLALREKIYFWKDQPFVFDTLLVVLMIVETWIIVALTMFGTSGGGGGMRSLSILRLLRLLRLTRMLRLMRAMPELFILVKGLVVALRSVCVSLLLLIALLFVFGIIFCQRYRDAEGVLHDEFFSRLGISMVTLFVQGTLLDEFTSVAIELHYDSNVMMGVYFLFMCMSSLTVLNMLIGVLTDVVSKIAGKEQKWMTFEDAKHALHQVFDIADQNVDDHLSAAEFQDMLQSEDDTVRQALADLSIERDRLWDLWRYIYQHDGEALAHPEGGPDTPAPKEAWVPEQLRHSLNSAAHKKLTFTEFFEELLIMKNNEAVSVRDMSILRRNSAQNVQMLEERITEMCDELRKVIDAEAARRRSNVLANTMRGSRWPKSPHRKLGRVPTDMLLIELEHRLQSH